MRITFNKDFNNKSRYIEVRLLVGDNMVARRIHISEQEFRAVYNTPKGIADLRKALKQVVFSLAEASMKEIDKGIDLLS